MSAEGDFDSPMFKSVMSLKSENAKSKKALMLLMRMSERGVLESSGEISDLKKALGVGKPNLSTELEGGSGAGITPDVAVTNVGDMISPANLREKALTPKDASDMSPRQRQDALKIIDSEKAKAQLEGVPKGKTLRGKSEGKTALDILNDNETQLLQAEAMMTSTTPKTATATATKASGSLRTATATAVPVQAEPKLSKQQNAALGLGKKTTSAGSGAGLYMDDEKAEKKEEAETKEEEAEAVPPVPPVANVAMKVIPKKRDDIRTRKDDPVEALPTLSDSIPPERMSAEFKSAEMLRSDIQFFLKMFPKMLKKEATIFKKTKSAVDLKKLHAMIVGKVKNSVDPPKPKDGSSGSRVGVVIDGEEYIRRQINELLTRSTFDKMRPEDMVMSMTDGDDKRTDGDFGDFEIKKTPSGGLASRREAIYKYMPTERDEAEKPESQRKRGGKRTRLEMPKSRMRTEAKTAVRAQRDNPFRKPIRTVRLKYLY